MAESEYTIKVKTDADTTDLESLRSALEEIRDNALATGEELSQGLEEAGSSADSTSESLSDAGNSAEELSGSLDSVNSGGLEDASRSAEELADNMEKSSENADNLNNSMGVMEGSMLLSASEQIGAMGDKTESMSQELDNAQITMGQLATQTGIAEGEMTNMINHISNVTFPRDEAMMYVKSLNQIGVSNENLGKSATDLDKINDAFGLGAGTVNSLGQELSVLGVDMNNVSDSFNALAYANSNTVGGMENYYSFLRKYDAQFNELGYDVDQASIIIAGATQKYGGGKAALSGLSEALKEADGDSRKLEEALDLQAGSLDNASQITGQYEGQLQQLADEEMEHKTITERLGAVWEDFSMTLAPFLSPLGSVVGLLGQVGSTALGINGIITLAETFGLLNSANLALIPSQIAEGIAGMASIAWVLIAVAVILILVGVLWYLYNNNEQVRQAIDNFGQTLQWIGGVIYSSFISALQQVWSTLLTLWNIVNTVIQGLINAVNSGNGNILSSIANVIVYLATLPTRLATIFVNMIAQALGFGNNFVRRMQQTAINSANNFIRNITSLPSRLMTELNNMLSAVNRWASTLPQKFWEAGVNAVKNFLSALGIASPGTMQRMLIWEINQMGERVPTESRGLLSNIGQLGSDVVDEFGNPSLNLNTNASLFASNNGDGNVAGNPPINIYIENVDSEDRVKQLVNEIERLLAWDNAKAGRTV